MKNSKNRTMATLIALFLMSAMAISLVPLPTANASDATTTAAKAAGMKWDFPGNENYNASATRLLLWSRWHDQIPTYVYIVPTPNPVGVGQEVTFIFFNPQVTSLTRYEFTIAITKPDGKTETLPPPGATGVYTESISSSGHFVSDATGSAWTQWTPDQVGNCTVTVKYWAHEFTDYATAANRDYYGVTLKESTATVTLVVQQEPVIPTAVTVYPLPSEYWTRPIEGQNTEWYRIASNWLSTSHDTDNGGNGNQYLQEGIAPNSGHILWTKVTENGGVVGGGNFSTVGEVFNAGHQYQTRFSNQIIMMGKLYYVGPSYWAGAGDIATCVDLLTGETIWTHNTTGVGAPSFGYLYDWDDMNQHGVVNPGMIFTSNFAREYHPLTGDVTSLNITSVPSGTEIFGPKGELLRYAITNIGNTTNPNWRLTQWNSSLVFKTESSGTINASLPSRYDWNVSIPTTFANAPTIRGVIYNDVLLGSNGTVPSAPSLTYSQNATFWAISLKTASRGQLLWMKTIDLVNAKNQQLDFQRAAEGVFVFQQDPDMSWVAYSIYTGEKLWDSSSYSEGAYNPYAYYISSTGYNPEGNTIAYGKLFSAGYSGMVFCYDLYNGTLLWRYEAPTHMEKFLYYTLMLGPICDGKIYVGTHEHSADTPLFKGNRVRCLNVTTGKEIWTMLGWANPYTMAIADGILIYWNNYDHQIYAVGKGPSATTVEAPLASITQGSSVVIRGTVTDISAGTKQKEQAADFPNGVPAVSDASMSAWMEYVYMQKPRPTNATGVEVTLDAVDPNGNFIHIGTVTSDTSGLYSYQWIPEVPGKYTVIATFAGSESYWPSYTETAIGVDAAPPATPPPPAAAPLPPFDMYIAIATVAIIITVAIATILILRKRP